VLLACAPARHRALGAALLAAMVGGGPAFVVLNHLI
jgi:hypothetical protein